MLGAETRAVGEVTEVSDFACWLQLTLRQGERDALQRLLEYVQQRNADKGEPPASPTLPDPFCSGDLSH